MSSAPTHRRLADLSLLLTAVLWGINIPVVKFSSEHVHPFVFNAVRMVLSTVVLGGLLAWERRGQRETAARATLTNQDRSRRHAIDRSADGASNATRYTINSRVIPSPPWMRIGIFIVLSALVYPLLFMSGILRTTAGNTALLLSSMPMWTAILSMIFLRERLPWLIWFGLLINLVGTTLIAVAKGNVNLQAEYLAGNLLIVSAALCWSSATVLSRPLFHVMSPLRLAFWSSLLMTPIHLVIVARDLLENGHVFFRPDVLASLVYSGTLSTGLAYATWHYGVSQLGASHASVYQNVVTIVAVLGGWAVLGETPRASQIVGGLLIFTGLVLIRRREVVARRTESDS